MDILPVCTCPFHYRKMTAGMCGYVTEKIIKIFEFVRVK